MRITSTTSSPVMTNETIAAGPDDAAERNHRHVPRLQTERSPLAGAAALFSFKLEISSIGAPAGSGNGLAGV
jgi:hypothetical protein